MSFYIGLDALVRCYNTLFCLPLPGQQLKKLLESWKAALQLHIGGALMENGKGRKKLTQTRVHE